MNERAVPGCPVCSHPSRALFTLGARDFHRCLGRRCRLTFVDPQPSDADLARYYAEDYFNDSATATPLTVDSIHEQVSAKMVELWCRPDPLILDYGCARGGMWSVLPPGLRGRYYGIESDRTAREDAARRTGRPIYATIEDFRADAPRWEVCIMINVVEHLRRPIDELRAIAAVGTPGGLIWVSTPNDGCLKRRLLRRRWDQYLDRTHLNIFSHKSLDRVLRGAGFCGVRRLRFRLRYSQLGPLRSAVQALTRPLGLDATLSVVAALPGGPRARGPEAAAAGAPACGRG